MPPRRPSGPSTPQIVLAFLLFAAGVATLVVGLVRDSEGILRIAYATFGLAVVCFFGHRLKELSLRVIGLVVRFTPLLSGLVVAAFLLASAAFVIYVIWESTAGVFRWVVVAAVFLIWLFLFGGMCAYRRSPR